MTTISLHAVAVSEVRADALIIGITSGPGGLALAPGATRLDTAIPGGLVPALALAGATGAAEEVTLLPTLGHLAVPVVAAVGLGPASSWFDLDLLRRSAGAAVRALAGRPVLATTLTVVNGAPGPGEAGAVAEGALLGGYRYRELLGLTRSLHPGAPDELMLLVPGGDSPALASAGRRAALLADAVGLCRDLVNRPASQLHPADLAAEAYAAGHPLGLDVTVLGEDELADGGYGGLLAVGSGSPYPPRLVRIGYQPSSPAAGPAVHLIGKGITFDSGGISLKTPDRLAAGSLKCDMAGAAAVLGCLVATARLGPDVPVVGWLPAAENMPSGSALRPSDVIRLRDGHTVEVLNTDAEGRLVLADAMARAGEEKPAVVIDVATLTGAQMSALGMRTAALMSDDEALAAQLLAAARRSGEPLWRMPLPGHLRHGLDSVIADLRNVGEDRGAMLTAGLFLREFVPAGAAWAHLDIAGPAFNRDKPFGYTPAGGTGFAVRALYEFIEARAAAG
jgi:leucyl aminopeptidase